MSVCPAATRKGRARVIAGKRDTADPAVGVATVTAFAMPAGARLFHQVAIGFSESARVNSRQ